MVESAAIASTGFVHDRLLMITNLSGHFLSQRSLPKMTLIQPELIRKPDGTEQMRLHAPDMDTIPFSVNKTGKADQVIVWGDWCFGVDQGDAVAAWLTAFLETDCRLVAMLDGTRRPVDPDYALTDNDVTSFTDGYPFLMISEASLDQLNGKLPTPIGMDRFRPNIVIAEALPHEEDALGQWKIGETIFSAVKLCGRCVMTTIDQMTAVKGIEPNKTLATYRRFNNKIYFGNNLIHHTNGIIRIGDKVTLQEDQS